MHSRTKIVLIAALPPPHHGVTVFNQNLLQSKIGQVFEIIHVDTSDTRNLDNVGRLDFGNVWLAFKNIAELKVVCLMRQPAIVYLPNSQNNMGFFRDGVFILVAKVLCNARIIIHYHGSETFTTFRMNTNAFMRWFIPFTLNKVDVGIVLGEKLKSVLDGLVKRVVVVPNGSNFDPPIKRKDHLDKPGLTVSFLGNLFRAKGVIDLLHAAGLVIRKHPEVNFKFAGEWWAQEPETKEDAFQIIADQHLDSHVVFVGKVLAEEKIQFLEQTDIFVFPTWEDSFGLVNLEAMAAGCPVISTKGVGAIEEVVIDGETGILIEKQKPQQIADAINGLIENPDLRDKMGRAGRERFENYYTMDRNVDRMIDVFCDALKS